MKKTIIFIIAITAIITGCNMFTDLADAVAKETHYTTSSPEYKAFIRNPTYETCNAYTDGYVRIEEAIIREFSQLITTEILQNYQTQVRELRIRCESLR